MSTQSGKGAPGGNDSFVERLGDRLSAEGGGNVLPLRRPDPPAPQVPPPPTRQLPVQVPPAAAFPPPPPLPHWPADPEAFAAEEPTVADPSSSVQSAPPDADLPEQVAPVRPNAGQDPFAQFEDEIEGEATRIDTQHLIAEQTTTILEDAPEPPYLEVESGKDAGKQFTLNAGETSIGRSIDNDIILTDIAVSRKHLTVIREDDGTLRARDLGSGNGSQLNGRRVYDSPVHEGDRIEIGETVMVVRVPGALGAALGSPPLPAERSTTDELNPPSLPPFGTVGLQGGVMPAVPPTGFVAGLGPGTSTDYIPSPRQVRTAPIPRSWLVAGLAVGGLLVALLGATLTALIIRSTDSGDRSADSDREAVFQLGVAYFAAKRWDDAQRAFEQALEEEPDDSRAQQYLTRVHAARQHQSLLRQARARLDDDPAEARRSAQSIPEDSPLAAEARQLVSEASGAMVDDLVAAGLSSVRAGELDAARESLAEARRQGTRSERVDELARAIEARGTAGSTGSTPSHQGEVHVAQADRPPAERTQQTPRERTPRERTPRERTPTVEQPGSSAQAQALQGQVLSLYRGGDITGAAQRARTGSESLPDADRTAMRALADRITRFADAYARVQRANYSANVQTYMRRAIDLDNQISGGHYARQIRPRMLEALLGAARNAMGGSNPAAGCAAVVQVLGVDAGNAEAQRMLRTCEQRAREMLTQAQGMESGNPTGAAEIYRRIQSMLPAQNPLQREAYRRYNSLRRPVDEDE